MRNGFKDAGKEQCDEQHAVSATDRIAYLGVSTILLVTALLACYIPARRAMQIETMQALRAE